MTQPAGLTLATTHHGELKALKYEHAGGVFENAAVEFDEAALAGAYTRPLLSSRSALLVGIVGYPQYIHGLYLVTNWTHNGSLIKTA